MKKISEHYLFVINVFLIAGLVGIGFWLQQSNAIITPTTPNSQIVSAASNTVAKNAAPVAASATAPTSTSSALPQKKTTATTPTIRRSRENESGERYLDE